MNAVAVALQKLIPLQTIRLRTFGMGMIIGPAPACVRLTIMHLEAQGIPAYPVTHFASLVMAPLILSVIPVVQLRIS
jgi:hypothetical protein